MKKLLACALLIGLLTCAGCFTAAPREIAPAATIAPVRAVQTLPPVTPEQITDRNGHQIAQELDDEMNREQQENMLTTPR